LSLLKEAIAAAKAGNKDHTRRLLREVTQLDPRNEVAWLWRASVAESPQDALAHLERVLEINPHNGRALEGVKAARLHAGVAAAKAQDKATARRLLRQVTDQDPNNEQVWLWLAGVAESPQEAVGFLQQVLRINPKHERALAGITWYRTQLAPPDSVSECPLCLKPAPKPQDRCPSCGSILSLGNLDAFKAGVNVDPAKLRPALDRYERRLREKADAHTHYYLGLAYLNLKRLDDAVTQLQAAARLRITDHALRAQVAALVKWQEAEQAAARDAAVREQARPVSVLIVDDSPTVRKLVTVTMERQGHRVVQAADGYEAVDRVREDGVPDLILLDIAMPGVDGYQLCKFFKQNASTAQVPVVMLSGKDGFFSKVRGRMAGSTEYITKPFKPESLLGLVDRYCRSKGAAKAMGSAGS
jgi:twitching motility two-component system response regulator PilG